MVVTSESDGECLKCQESYNEGEDWLCVISGTMRTVLKSNSSHSVILLDYINGLYYL